MRASSSGRGSLSVSPRSWVAPNSKPSRDGSRYPLRETGVTSRPPTVQLAWPRTGRRAASGVSLTVSMAQARITTSARPSTAPSRPISCHLPPWWVRRSTAWGEIGPSQAWRILPGSMTSASVTNKPPLSLASPSRVAAVAASTGTIEAVGKRSELAILANRLTSSSSLASCRTPLAMIASGCCV